MAGPDDNNISRLSLIAFILAFIVLLLSIIYNRPTPAPVGALDHTTRSV